MKTEEAVKKLTSEIKKDAGLRENYRTKIAIAFYVECIRNQVDDDFPLELLHRIAYKAADNFLDQWCESENTKR